MEKLTKKDNYLVVLMEECAELTKHASKAVRFGPENCHPDEVQTNADKIVEKYYRLGAVVEQMQKSGDLATWNEETIETVKRLEVEKIDSWKEFYETAVQEVSVDEEN